MKRLLWLGVGLAIGALVARTVTKKAQSYTPSGIAAAARDSGRNLIDSAREFVNDVRDGMHEREQELRAAFTDGVAIDDLDDEFDDLDDDDLDGLDGLDDPGAEQSGPPARTAPPEGTIR